MRPIVSFLLLASGLAPAAEIAVPPLPGQTQEEPLNREEEGWSWFGGVIGFAGSSHRIDQAYVVERQSGEVLDAGILLGLRQVSYPEEIFRSGAKRVRTLSAFGGSDRLAQDEADGLASLEYIERCWRRFLPLYAVSARGGYSEEREWLASGEVVAGLAHFGIERDASGRSYRVGLKAFGPSDKFPTSLSLDRIISYQNDDRRLATQLKMEMGYPLSEHLVVTADGSYTHGAIFPDGHSEGTWTVSVGLAWKLDDDF